MLRFRDPFRSPVKRNASVADSTEEGRNSGMKGYNRPHKEMWLSADRSVPDITLDITDEKAHYDKIPRLIM